MVLLALILGVAGCSIGQPSSASKTPRATPAAAVPMTSPSPGQPAETPAPTAPGTASPVPPAPVTTAPPSSGLVFSGDLTGRTSATYSTGACGATPGGYAAQLAFAMTSQSYSLTIEVFDYQGAGRYSVPPGRISVRGPGANPQPLYPALSGSVTIDSSGRSGTLDVSLGVRNGSSQLSGSWAC